jgi:UDP-glucuronate decarboxylase
MALDDGRAVSNFIVQALKNEPLTVHGSGSQTRSFCYVLDMVEALVLASEQVSCDTVPLVINLGNPKEVTIEHLATRISELCGSTAGLRHIPLPLDDPTKRNPCIDRAKTILGWTPVTSLEDGLRKTVADFRLRMGLTLPVPVATP